MSVELKLKTLTPTEIAEVTGGTLEIYGNMDAGEEIRFVTHNSKETGDGVLFCAIKGQRVDGSDFIPDAIDAGSRCFLCSRDLGYSQKYKLKQGKSMAFSHHTNNIL